MVWPHGRIHARSGRLRNRFRSSSTSFFHGLPGWGGTELEQKTNSETAPACTHHFTPERAGRYEVTDPGEMTGRRDLESGASERDVHHTARHGAAIGQVDLGRPVHRLAFCIAFFKKVEPVTVPQPGESVRQLFALVARHCKLDGKARAGLAHDAADHATEIAKIAHDLAAQDGPFTGHDTRATARDIHRGECMLGHAAVQEAANQPDRDAEVTAPVAPGPKGRFGGVGPC